MLKLVLLVLSCQLLRVHAVNPDPRKVLFSNVTFDTTKLIEKLEHALQHYDQPHGRQIRFKPNDGCLDGDKNHGAFYTPFSDEGCEEDWPMQEWRLVDGQLQVANYTYLNKLPNPKADACLDCWDNEPKCDLHIGSCFPESTWQQYFIKIHNDQVNFEKEPPVLYFSIHGKIHPESCLTYYLNIAQQHGEMFRLDECTGLAEQSFYLPGVDFTEELTELYNCIRFYPVGCPNSTITNS